MTSAAERLIKAGFSLDRDRLIEQLAAMLDRAELAEATVREMRAATRGSHGDSPGHWQCVPMTRVAELIRDKLNAVGQRDEATRKAREVLAQAGCAREVLEAALTEWEPEHARASERAERKGYAHDEIEAAVYGAAIKTVREALAVLDGEESDHG